MQLRGKDLETALGIPIYSPKCYASSVVKKLVESAAANVGGENNNEREQS